MFYLRILQLVFVSFTCAAPASAQQAQTRLALVIANSDYNQDGLTNTPLSASELLGFVSDLPNPKNDGPAIRDALIGLGFDVTFIENANRERMISELAMFGGRIAQAPPNAVVVFYYSGHAMQVNGVNLLLPTGARIPRDQDLSRLPAQQAETLIGAYSVPANIIFDQLRVPDAGGLNLVILDSCRNNPWEQRLNGRSRSIASRGLAEQTPRLSRTLVAFSTAAGDVAADGEDAEGANSPYTRALLQWIRRPGYTILQMLNNVGRDVVAATGQVPWMNNAPLDDICLAGCPSGNVAAASPAPPGELQIADVGTATLPEALRAATVAQAAVAHITQTEWSSAGASTLIPRLLDRAPFAGLLSLANAGDSKVQWVVGSAYLDGLEMALDYQQALIWLQRSANQGDPRGQVSLGFMYDTGQGVARDSAQALIWYRRAADQGNAIAQNNMGVMYREGRGIARDDAQAVSWFRRSADSGSALGQVNLGYMYEKGRGVASDIAQALTWYRRAADQGDAVAQDNLGQMHENGRGVRQDYGEALVWYRKAADQGFADGQNHIGGLYKDGHGVTQDYAQAMIWYRRAADQGNAWAQSNIGWLYEHGHGVAQDYAQAAAWYRRSADQGNLSGRCNLGILTYAGQLGLPQDREAGLSLIRLAVADGSNFCRNWLRERGLS